METRPVRFISSTTVALRDYRDKVRDVVQRLRNAPITAAFALHERASVITVSNRPRLALNLCHQ